MVIQIEIGKIEKAFGSDRWAVRFGDIAGSTDMHNISKADLIKAIIDEIEEESERLSDNKTSKIILGKLFDESIHNILVKIESKYKSGSVNSALYNFKEELKKKIINKK